MKTATITIASLAVLLALTAPAAAQRQGAYDTRYRPVFRAAPPAPFIGMAYRQPTIVRNAQPYFFPSPVASYYSARFIGSRISFTPSPVVMVMPTLAAAPNVIFANPTVVTYVDQMGRLCRGYESQISTGAGFQLLSGVACLYNDGAWRVVQ
ncbi:MAG: hypothetical protein FWF24_01025 [Alphaproteobacteria bacterium]|nr:hypothetical protein [Alphaproteobacteria bacterium]